ncbi:hypothetical protein FWK35_00025050, partial [Aphis craccivora]
MVFKYGAQRNLLTSVPSKPF